MKLVDAQRIMGDISSGWGGYRVRFDIERPDGTWESDSFPAAGEKPIESEEAAWNMARNFSRSAPEGFYNIGVVHATDNEPVRGHDVLKMRHKRIR